MGETARRSRFWGTRETVLENRDSKNRVGSIKGRLGLPRKSPIGMDRVTYRPENRCTGLARAGISLERGLMGRGAVSKGRPSKQSWRGDDGDDDADPWKASTALPREVRRLRCTRIYTAGIRDARRVAVGDARIGAAEAAEGRRRRAGERRFG